MADAKRVADSQTTLVQMMEIAHANIAGIVHGGEVMKLVDTAAGIAAIKHAGGMCVTVRSTRCRSCTRCTSATS